MFRIGAGREGNVPFPREIGTPVGRWCPQSDLNRRPTAYKAVALPLSYAGDGEQYKTALLIGAVERSRTSDLLITNQLLYQLSYNSTIALTEGRAL